MSQHEHHWDRTRTLTGFSRPTAALPPQAGRTAALQIGAPVGHGGQVFEVEGGAGSGRRVIKLLPRGTGRPAEVVARFTQEATRVANLRHPHVVQVVDAGTFPEGTPFVVMERLPGATLAEAVEGGPLPTVELVSILRGVASALSAAHAVGVAHGAVSAENVFLVDVPGYSHGFSKLLDFGVARLDGGASDPRGDQRALATLACQLLTGSSTCPDAVTDPRCPSVYRVLARAMADQPDQRFDSVASFFQALQTALLVSGTELPTPATAPTSPAPPSSLTQQFFAEGDRQERAQAAEATDEDDAGADDSLAVSGAVDRLPRRRAPMIAAAAIAVGSLAIVGFTVLSLSRAHHPATWSAVASAPPPAAVPEAKAPAPVSARTRTTVRRPRPAGNATPATVRPNEPPPLAPIGTPPAPPAPAAVAVTAPATPASAAPAPAPSSEDFTSPSEETEAAPIPGQPAEEAPPPAAAPPSN